MHFKKSNEQDHFLGDKIWGGCVCRLLEFYLFIYLAIGKVRSIILVNLPRLAAIQVLVEVIALATWGEFSHIPLSINDANNVPAR